MKCILWTSCKEAFSTTVVHLVLQSERSSQEREYEDTGCFRSTLRCAPGTCTRAALLPHLRLCLFVAHRQNLDPTNQPLRVAEVELQNAEKLRAHSPDSLALVK